MCGLNFYDAMSMNLKEISSYADGFVYKRECIGNDMMHIAHVQSVMISQAVWGSNEFPKKTPEFRIRPYTDEEIIKIQLESIENMMNQVNSVMGMSREEEMYNKIIGKEKNNG